MRWWPFLLLVGCGQPKYVPEPVPDLIPQVDELNVKLLVAAERVRFWEEMRARSIRITEFACKTSVPEAPEWVSLEETDE